MTFEFQFRSKSRLTSRSAKYLLLTSALCGLSCVHADAAPLPTHKPAGIGVTMPATGHVVWHRSIWAIKWAAAHPAEEAKYLVRIEDERHYASYRASHHMVAATKLTNTASVSTSTPVVVKAVTAAPVALPTATASAVNAKTISAAPVALVPAASEAAAPKTTPVVAVIVAPIHASTVALAPKTPVPPIDAKANPVAPVQLEASTSAIPFVGAALSTPTIKAEPTPIVSVTDAAVSDTVPSVPEAAVVAAQPVKPKREAMIRSAAEAGTSSGSEQQHRAAYDSENSSGDVTLDFVAADINDVIKALAVQTGANIVSSTDVKGTITVSLSHVTLDQALDMIARLSGYQYAKVGSTFVIGTPAGLAAFTGEGSDQTPVSAVVSFNYASFANLSNTLAVRFPDLKVADGSAISGSSDGAQYKAILLSGDASTVAQARDLIAQIDMSLGANVADQSTVVYKVQYASTPDLITILGSLVPNLVVTAGPRQGFMAKAPSATAAASSSGASASGTSGSGGAASGATGSSQSSATGPNMLLLTGTQSDVARAQVLLADVDVQPAQLTFDTKVTEVDVTKVNKLGLNWDFTGATTRIGEEPDNVANPPAALGTNGQTNLLSFGAIGRTAVSDLATITMDALIQNGDAKLLADPNISAVDGQPAQVFIGNTVNYVESITQTTTGQNITTGSVQVGVILRVTGKVDSDGYITLNIHPEVSEITSFLTVPGGGSLPEVASRYADTTIRVKNGETIAIGGLIQENETKNVNKVPGLGDLPFIGKAFQDTQDNKERDEVVFLLTTRASS